MEKRKKANVFMLLFIFGIILGASIVAVSQNVYGRLYFFDGFFITKILWIACFLCVGIGLFGIAVTANHPYIAGILFVGLVVYQLFNRSLSSVYWWLDLVAYILIAVALLLKQRNKLLVIGFSLFAVQGVIGLFVGIAGRPLPFMMLSLVFFIASVGMALLSVAVLTDFMKQYKKTARQLWFIPSVCYFIYALFRPVAIYLLIKDVYYNFSEFIRYDIIEANLQSYAFYFVYAACMLFSSVWIAYPEGFPAKSYNRKDSGNQSIVHEKVYCEMWKHVLLLLFTFGIWYLIWIYRVTEYLNQVEDEPPRNPTTKLLLCLFVPFYAIYWVYKSAQRLDRLAKVKGVPSDLSTLCLILAIFVGIIPPILMQDKINAIIDVENGKGESTYTYDQPHTTKETMGVTEELKAYKELLDSGVITQEEFDAKKKQLLGL